MKHLFYILTTIVINLLIVGCSTCLFKEDIHLSEDAKEWVPYKLADTLLFETHSKQDTVMVTYYYERQEDWGGYECEYMIDIIDVTLKSNLFQDSIVLRLYRNDELLIKEPIEFKIFHENGSSEIYPDNDSDKKYLKTWAIYDKTFNNVIMSKCRKCIGLKEIYLSKKVGLLAFNYKDEYWFLK
ncbi:hypothetical protein QWY31_05955 [Cytophagales bacterium LB-30]|uniref:Lipoprotein n=1 Tax=Shiella aurantiaca TaxID=3058365 RepID=A0ABT8F3K6_9BACT|nr:hypothetical protein [Shiella aurantiaca]MDN4165037.1 hypothetical protein [Shiella aurantiaca]